MYIFNQRMIPNRGHADIGNRQTVGQVKSGGTIEIFSNLQ